MVAGTAAVPCFLLQFKSSARATGSHNQHCPIRTGSPRPWLERWGRLWHARITGGRPPAPRPCRRRPRQAGGQAPGSASVEATRASPSGATQYLSTAVAERLGLIVHRTKDPTILFGLGYVASTPDSGPILDPVTNTVHRPCHPCSRRTNRAPQCGCRRASACSKGPHQA